MFDCFSSFVISFKRKSIFEVYINFWYQITQEFSFFLTCQISIKLVIKVNFVKFTEELSISETQRKHLKIFDILKNGLKEESEHEI